MRLATAASQAAERIADAQDVLFEVLGSDDSFDDTDGEIAEVRRILVRLSEVYDDLEEIALE